MVRSFMQYSYTVCWIIFAFLLFPSKQDSPCFSYRTPRTYLQYCNNWERILMRRDWVQNCTSIYMLSRENNIRYFTAINKKRMAEEKKLSQGLEKYTVLRRDHIHKKEEVRPAVKTWEFAFFLLTDKKYKLKIFCLQS